MTRVSFEKYSAQGNNFVLIDELDKIVVPEESKARFAIIAQDVNFGIGGDDVLFLQRPSRLLFEQIDGKYPYWRNLSPEERENVERLFLDSSASEAFIVFRIFDPDGTEALTCGNGLRCAADYISEKLGLSEVTFLAEIPSRTPRLKHVKRSSNLSHSYEVNMGNLLRPPLEYVHSDFITEYVTSDSPVGIVQNYRLKQESLFGVQQVDSQEWKETTAFITYTGELHLVFYCGAIESLSRLESYREGPLASWLARLFPVADVSSSLQEPITNSTQLNPPSFHELAMHFNNGKIDSLPQGLNVNIGMIHRDGRSISYRVFERLKNREVYSCGSGAVAVAAIAQLIGLIPSREATVMPLFGQSFQGNFKGHLQVTTDEQENYWLTGPVEHVFSGALHIQAM